MEPVRESVTELLDHDTISVDGLDSVYSDSESVLLRSDGEDSIVEPVHRDKSGIEDSIVEPVHRDKSKRLGKRRRRRFLKNLYGSSLTPISEAPNSEASGTPKRNRVVSGSTPELAAKKMRTYANVAAASTIKKFCVRENNPEISLDVEKMGIFRTELSRRVLSTVKATGMVPQMLGCYLVDSVIICKCSNDETYKWFCEQVSEIRDIWDGCQLSVGDPPKPLILHTWVPGPPEEPSTVISNINLLNPNVSTKEWKVVRSKREANRLSVVIRVDRKSFDFITGSRLTLQYLLERISFKIISGP